MSNIQNFLLALGVTCLIATILTVILVKNGSRRRKVIRWGLVVSILLAPVYGGIAGTFYSHGFDVPWWLFGIAASLIFFSCTLLASFVGKLLLDVQ
jgi:hypothetical protein